MALSTDSASVKIGKPITARYEKYTATLALDAPLKLCSRPARHTDRLQWILGYDSMHMIDPRGFDGNPCNTAGTSTIAHLLRHVTLRRFCSGRLRPGSTSAPVLLTQGSSSDTLPIEIFEHRRFLRVERSASVQNLGPRDRILIARHTAT